jgi:hypothetical protein
VGAGAWEVQIPLYQRNTTTLETDYYAHNEWLQLLSEYGLLVGGLVIAVWLAYLLKSAGSTWHVANSNVPDTELRASTLASLFAICFVSNAGFPWHLATTGVLIALCLAVLASTDAEQGVQIQLIIWLPWKPRLSEICVILSASCVLLAMLITRQAFEAENKLMQALLLADGLRKPQSSQRSSIDERKAQALKLLRLGIALNPHYRKVTGEVAEPFAAGGDWANAVWILASVAKSRPNVYAIWVGLANGYSQLGQHDQAWHALMEVKRLKPQAISTATLEVLLLAREGQTKTAIQLINGYFDQGHFDYDMVQAGYALGYKASNWPLAIRSLTLRASTWPEHTADAEFRLGKVYSETTARNDGKAIEAFEKGFDAVPIEQQENYLSQVPMNFRQLIKKHRPSERCFDTE